MTLLALYRSATIQGTGQPSRAAPGLITSDPERIQGELGERGIRYERWPTRPLASAGSGGSAKEQWPEQQEILAIYSEEIARVQAKGGYRTVDAIRLTPDHPDRDALRSRFLAEHTHAEDEVRFFVEGQGLFCLHLGDEVLQLICTQGDWIAVPAGSRHWFDMGPDPAFCALRFFDNSEGWVAHFTGDPIADRYPRLDELLTRAAAVV